MDVFGFMRKEITSSAGWNLSLTSVIAVIAMAASTGSNRSFPERNLLSKVGVANYSRFQLTDHQDVGKIELIKPGLGVGNLRLGDSRDKALSLFPSNINQEDQRGDCGNTYTSLDGDGSTRGYLYITTKDGVVSQIEVATTRFRTAEGINTESSPARVRDRFPGLSAFVLSPVTSKALGNLPLIYWIDSKKGIAFAFAYFPEERRRYLYEIVVFKPNSPVCSFYGSADPQDKRELPPYSLEIPDYLTR